ncbi:MAG TPA: heavy metal-binding domain-containing protein [Candidatus Latescibacteria bacterium]|nr:heavy metal-binding domain-containing protein [Candidatus Latescibacterota bacterium]
MKGYTELLDRARQEALSRMGANAVIGVRSATSQLMQGAAEVLAYGTAVVVEDD